MKRLNWLVFVQFNAKLEERKKQKRKDPLISKDHQYALEWTTRMGNENENEKDKDTVQVEDEEVFPGEGLTWGMVSQASGADELLHPRRSARHATHAAGTSTTMPSTSALPELIEEDNLDDEMETDEDNPLDMDDEDIDYGSD